MRRLAEDETLFNTENEHWRRNGGGGIVREGKASGQKP